MVSDVDGDSDTDFSNSVSKEHETIETRLLENFFIDNPPCPLSFRKKKFRAKKKKRRKKKACIIHSDVPPIVVFYS